MSKPGKARLDAPRCVPIWTWWDFLVGTSRIKLQLNLVESKTKLYEMKVVCNNDNTSGGVCESCPQRVQMYSQRQAGQPVALPRNVDVCQEVCTRLSKRPPHLTRSIFLLSPPMSGPLSDKLSPKNHHLLQALSLDLELPLADLQAAIPLTRFLFPCRAFQKRWLQGSSWWYPHPHSKPLS